MARSLCCTDNRSYCSLPKHYRRNLASWHCLSEDHTYHCLLCRNYRFVGWRRTGCFQWRFAAPKPAVASAPLCQRRRCRLPDNFVYAAVVLPTRRQLSLAVTLTDGCKCPGANAPRKRHCQEGYSAEHAVDRFSRERFVADAAAYDLCWLDEAQPLAGVQPGSWSRLLTEWTGWGSRRIPGGWQRRWCCQHACHGYAIDPGRAALARLQAASNSSHLCPEHNNESTDNKKHSIQYYHYYNCLQCSAYFQCFETVGWAAGKTSGL